MGAVLIYLDANVVIRLVEGDSVTRAPLEARLKPFLGVAGSLSTSRLTRLECRTKPLQANDLATLSSYELFFSGMELKVVELDPMVVEVATEVRARYGLRTPDALHLASAVAARSTLFLTGDQSFTKCREIPVEIL